jgi:hypothetical protein
MTIIKPVSRRWFLGGLIAAPVIVATSNIMPVRAMEWIGAPRWEGTADHFAWRTRPDKLVPTNRRFAWCQDRTTKIWKKVEPSPATMQPDIELVHRGRTQSGVDDRFRCPSPLSFGRPSRRTYMGVAATKARSRASSTRYARPRHREGCNGFNLTRIRSNARNRKRPTSRAGFPPPWEAEFFTGHRPL